jgi:preprotein translocase subunit SecG
MQSVIIVIHLMVVLAMIGVVLLQKSEGGGLGMGGGGGGGFLSSRGQANVLTRATAILAAVFFSTSLVLSILAGIDRKPASSIVGAPVGGQTQPGGSGGSLLDQFPSQPAQPAAPQAPRSQ